MTYSPNFALEALRGVLTIAGWYVLFYLRRRPASKLRRRVLLVSFPAAYIFFMLIPLSPTGNTVLWAAIIILFALLCGGLRESLFTAIYYIGMEACIDTLDGFIARHSFGRWFPAYTLGYYVNYNVQYLIVLAWALFYYLVLKDRRGKVPLRLWVMLVIPPLCSLGLLTFFANTARLLQADMGINIYPVGIVMGLFLVANNLITFYVNVRLLVYSESRQQAVVLQGQLDAYARRVTMIEDFQRQTAEMRHDLKNILFTLNIDMQQQNYDQVNQRIADLLGHLQQVEPKRYTGNTLVDAVISYKAVRLQELGVALAIQADLLDLESSLAYDIAAIMGTALDNVTDACELLHTADGDAAPAVYCLIQRKKNMLFIRLTNPLPAPLCYKDGEIQSTKAESGHGLGLSALRRIAQKYNGEIDISDRDGLFSLAVMLYV